MERRKRLGEYWDGKEENTRQITVNWCSRHHWGRKKVTIDKLHFHSRGGKMYTIFNWKEKKFLYRKSIGWWNPPGNREFSGVRAGGYFICLAKIYIIYIYIYMGCGGFATIFLVSIHNCNPIYMSTLGFSTDGIATIYNNATTRNDHHTIIPLTQNVTIPPPTNPRHWPEPPPHLTRIWERPECFMFFLLITAL